MGITKIILRELRLSCLIGVDPAERHVRQTLLLDVDITLGGKLSGKITADKTPPLDYRVVITKLRALAAGETFGLMETFATRAADLLLDDSAAKAVRIYCRKPTPLAGLAAAGVEVQRPA